MSEAEKAIVGLAKQHAGKKLEVVELSTGYLAEISPVSLSILNDVQLTIKMPEVPTWFNENKGKEEENPNDPAYLAAVQDVDTRRNLAAADAMIMFGVQLVDTQGSPFRYDDDMHWLKKLRYFEKRGLLSLADFDLEDDFDLEFLFKKYVAVGAADIMTIGKMSGVSEEAVQSAQASFQGDS
jgi:hypothetical protein